MSESVFALADYDDRGDAVASICMIFLIMISEGSKISSIFLKMSSIFLKMIFLWISRSFEKVYIGCEQIAYLSLFKKITKIG